MLGSKLAMFADFKTFGEEFKPYFLGSPKTRHIMDVQLQKPIQSLMLLLEKFKQKYETASGFQYFYDYDHNLLVLFPYLRSPRANKIILTCNPFESCISWNIAAKTERWELQNIT